MVEWKGTAMRGNKFEKSQIHILESKTLRRKYRITESAIGLLMYFLRR